MGSFKFADRTIRLEIEGKKYAFVCDSSFADSMKRYAEESTTIANSVGDENVRASNSIGLCQRVIDEVLGGGSFTDIFSNREPTLPDCCDLINFMADEVRAQVASARSAGSGNSRRPAKK